MRIKTLNDMQIRTLKPKAKQYRVCVDRNLYLYVYPSGRKAWGFRLRGGADKKDSAITIGSYPAITLERARSLAKELTIASERGASIDELKIIIDPQSGPKVPSFKEVSAAWLQQKALKVTVSTLESFRYRLEKYVYPALGESPVSEVTARELLELLTEVQLRGNINLAHRLKQLISGVMKQAVVMGLAEYDPCSNLVGQLQTVKHKSYGAIIDQAGIAELIRRINAYESVIVRLMMRFSLLTFQRPSEIRLAEWSEIDFTAKTWSIPVTRKGNKRGRPHQVPLSRQALDVLRELDSFKSIAGNSSLLFPGRFTPGKPVGPLNANVLSFAFSSMGYKKGTMTGHGFRHLASTSLNSMGQPSELIELQLAHMDENSVRARYNFADKMPERTLMMQRWADWLDSLDEKYPAQGGGQANG